MLTLTLVTQPFTHIGSIDVAKHNIPILFTKRSTWHIGRVPAGLIGRPLSGRLQSRSYGPASLFGSPDPNDPNARATICVVRLDFPIRHHVIKSSRWGKRRVLETVDIICLIEHEDRIETIEGELPPIFDGDSAEEKARVRAAVDAYWASPEGQARENAPLYR